MHEPAMDHVMSDRVDMVEQGGNDGKDGACGILMHGN